MLREIKYSMGYSGRSGILCVGKRMMMCALDHACYLKCKLDVYSAVVETIN
jgi:hypothetical protein